MLHLVMSSAHVRGQLIHLSTAVQQSRDHGVGEGGVKVAWGGSGFEWSDDGQMCGWRHCRRCGSFGQPILNHQSSQHLDILENHICATGDAHENTHTQCILYPIILPLLYPHTHTHWKSLKTVQEGNWIVHVLLFERCSALARPHAL